MESRWIWRVLAIPGVAWLSIFFLIALYAVLCVALGNQNTLSEPIPYWNPLDWNVGYLFQTLSNIVHDGPFLKVFLRTVVYVVIAMAVFDVAKYFIEEEVIRGRRCAPPPKRDVA